MAAKKSDTAPIPPGAARQPVSVHFEETPVTYASQFVVNASAEEFIVGFSSGVMDSADGRTGRVLPVQSRVAMSRPAASRLVRLLADALRHSKPAEGTGTGTRTGGD